MDGNITKYEAAFHENNSITTIVEWFKIESNRKSIFHRKKT